MLRGLTDRVKDEAGYSARVLAIAAAAAVSAAVVAGFLVAALFLRVAQFYGPFRASLACAGVFVLATLVLWIVYAVTSAGHRRREEARRAADSPSAAMALADPRIILLGLQVVQAIGVRRLLPLMAVAGAGLALASRSAANGRRAQPSPPPPTFTRPRA